MAVTAYAMCIVTALACAVLLTRAYRASRFRLLFWSALCFWGLSVANALILVDLRFTGPDIDLYWVRLTAGVLSMGLLVYGLVWESR
jgi:Family of unknown function (DUF5985)